MIASRNLDEMQGLPEDAPGELGVPTVGLAKESRGSAIKPPVAVFAWPGRLTADDERKVATWGEQWAWHPGLTSLGWVGEG